MRISLPIIVQVRSWVGASSSLTSHQYDFTLSYSVKNENKHSLLAANIPQRKNVCCSPTCWVADQPEEHAHSSTTSSSMGSAGSHFLPVQLADTAGALRAKHCPTKQAQGRMLPVIICGLWTPEDKSTEKSRKLYVHGHMKDGKLDEFVSYWKWLALLRRIL